MMKEPEQDIWSLAQPRETLIQLVTNFCLGLVNGIFHASLDITMTILFWIELWRISWQVFAMNFGMLLKKRLHNLGLVSTRLIPDQNERTVDMPQKVLQSDDHLFSIDRAVKMSFVDLARNRQTNHGGCFSAELGDALQSWCSAFWRPGEADRFCIGNPKFIFKHDFCAEPPRFFLSWANPCSTRFGSILHPVQSLALPAFVHSSPVHSIID